MRSDSSSERQEPNSHRSQAENVQCNSRHSTGRLSIVSLGPGYRSYMVPEALDVLLSAEVVLGYKTYLGLIEELLEGKEVLSSGMRKEVDRCGLAIDRALEGRRVVLVSSGDAGIYGMAGLVFDICRERSLRISNPPRRAPSTEPADLRNEEGELPPDLFVEVIPGVAAFNAAASILGAPLMHDFAVVSLSDHLTPWELIEKRLQAAASADFVMAIYNPRSKTRPDLLEKAQKVILREKAPETPVAIIRKAMRDGQWKCITTLAEIPFEEVDMQSILIVGNSKTYVWNGWMVTPRGYLDKYNLSE